MTTDLHPDAPWLDSLQRYLAHYADATPEAEALVCNGARYSYAAAAAEVDAFAGAMLASGVKPGDRVATLAPPGADFLFTFLAASSIGAIWCGLNPKYTARELAYVLGDCQPVLLLARAAIGGRDLMPLLQEALGSSVAPASMVLLDKDDTGPMLGRAAFLARRGHVASGALARARADADPSAAALLVYTSGTTGAPKGALIAQRSLAFCSRVAVDNYGARRIRILNNLPINHIGCVGDISGYALAGGGTIVFMEQFDAAGSLRTIAQERITVWGQVPTMFQLSLAARAQMEECDLSSLEVILWSGAAASASLVAALAPLAPRLVTSSGTTETVGSVTYTAAQADAATLAGTIGRPCPRFALRLADEAGRLAAPGTAGEIQLNGPMHMLGYFQRPEATREAFTVDGWLRTGDIALERPDGNLALVGRLKEMFKSGGYNVYPREIELVLESFPGVEMAAVIARPDPLFGEVGVAFVLSSAGVEEAALLAHCRARLANYKMPKQVRIEGAFPMLPIGKIDKQALKKLLTEQTCQ